MNVLVIPAKMAEHVTTTLESFYVDVLMDGEEDFVMKVIDFPDSSYVKMKSPIFCHFLFDKSSQL